MSPELIKSIASRISAGQSYEDIKTVVLALGHTEEIFSAAYTLALHDIERGPLLVATRSEDEIAVIKLFRSAFALACTRLDLVALLAIPMVVTVILDQISVKFEGHLYIGSLAEAGAVLAILFYLYFLGVALYFVTKERTTEITYKEALVWSRKNIGPLLWIYILVFLVVSGGFLFFVIPAIIVLVYTYFAQFVFVHEGKTGMVAVLRSREIVTGRFWFVAKKLFGLLFLTTVPLMILLLILEAVMEEIKMLPLELLSGIVSEVAVAFIALLNLFAIHALYQYLAKERTVSIAPPLFLKVRYWLLAIAGVLFVVLIGVVAFFSSTIDSLYEKMPIVVEEVIQTEVSHTGLLAREYSISHNGSYEGVCEVLRPSITSTDNIECNNSPTQWAIAAEAGEERFCADTNTYMKRINTPLADRFSCIELSKNSENTTPVENTVATDTAAVLP